MIIVGSKAMEYWGVCPRTPNDIDVWLAGTGKPYRDETGREVHYLPDTIISAVRASNGFIELDDLYTLKVSHSHWDVHWQKTMADICWLKSKGCVLRKELYDILYVYWSEINGNKDFLSLNKSKQEFFTDGVTYHYDHDYLHELVAYPNKPVYKECLKDGEEVRIDKTKFFSMSKEKQLTMFLEEIRVIAVERWMIPNNFDYMYTKAYLQALKKTITNLTKGWASLFIVENYDWYRQQLNIEFLNHIKKEVNYGE